MDLPNKAAVPTYFYLFEGLGINSQGEALRRFHASPRIQYHRRPDPTLAVHTALTFAAHTPHNGTLVIDMKIRACWRRETTALSDDDFFIRSRSGNVASQYVARAIEPGNLFAVKQIISCRQTVPLRKPPTLLHVGHHRKRKPTVFPRHS